MWTVFQNHEHFSYFLFQRFACRIIITKIVRIWKKIKLKKVLNWKSSDQKKPVEKQRKTNLKTKKNSRVREYAFLETCEYFCLICEHFFWPVKHYFLNMWTVFRPQIFKKSVIILYYLNDFLVWTFMLFEHFFKMNIYVIWTILNMNIFYLNDFSICI
jgi:hypothetical protein